MIAGYHLYEEALVIFVRLEGIWIVHTNRRYLNYVAACPEVKILTFWSFLILFFSSTQEKF